MIRSVSWTLRALGVSIALCLTLASARAADVPTVLILGDSLSAEYGLPRGSGWVTMLANRLASQGVNGRKYSVANASISGETTVGGRSRLGALLKQQTPFAVVIELGANDGLRGLPLAQMRENLQAMIDASQSAGARVLLIGMQVPPNYGRAYTDGFAQTFAQVARATDTALVPFMFAGFADQPEYFLPDRLHPNERAQPRILETVWPGLKQLLAAPKR